MSINFQLDYQSSDFVSDISETATIPIDGELFTGDQLKHLATEIMGIQYGLGLPGIRGGVVAAWGSNTVLGIGSASGTTVVFAATQTLVAGQLIAGASPTSTGFRRVTAGGTGLTFTVDSSFSAAISAATITSHYTVAQRIQDIETTQAATQARPVMLAIQRDSGDTDHDLEITEYYADGTSVTITKQLDATFADGDNAGGMQSGDSLPTSGVVYIYRLTQDSNGSVDFIATDGSALVVPSGYTQASASYVIQWLTDSSANLVALTYDHMAGVMLHTGTLALDLSVTDQGTTRTTRTAANAPPNVVALCRYENIANTPGSGVIKIEPLAHTDQAPAFSSASLGQAASARVQGEMLLRLDASRQYATDASEASCDIYIQITGWLWRPML